MTPSNLKLLPYVIHSQMSFDVNIYCTYFLILNKANLSVEL